MMTIQQVLWARKHDWFIKTQADIFKGVWCILVRDDMVVGNTLSFTDFDELKHWAGY